MFPGRIVGNVVASQKVSSLNGKKLLLVQPLTWDKKPDGEPLVALDAVGSGAGEFVFYVKAREAAVAFKEIPPIDASIVGIIDGVIFHNKEYDGK